MSRLRLALIRAPFLFVLGLLLGSCAGDEIREKSAWKRPLPYTILVTLPPRPELDATTSGTAQSRLSLNRLRLVESIEERIATLNVCTNLHIVQASRVGAVQLALDREADMLVEILGVSDAQFQFHHRTAWFLPNTLLWFFLGFPSFWVPDRIYEVNWDVRFRVSWPSAAMQDIVFRETFKEEVGLHLADRGWTSEALYTPPGFYEGPDTAEHLAPAAESWLVERLLRILKEQGRAAHREPVQMRIVSPINSSQIATQSTRLYARIVSDTPLESIRLEVNGAIAFERNPLNMMKARRFRLPGESKDLYGYEIDETINVAPGANNVRLLARHVRGSNLKLESEDLWSATQTIRFFNDFDGVNRENETDDVASQTPRSSR